ncbi:thiol-disulfide oxidoreductase DCC family protein [Rufibacter sediminis]|uniref:Thiol-disulfide oxidoreductase DCC family protein n=1 Tax=Rufibacter sediminis TaxID=2762756 RepID=A0ABR6VMB4_9BACT|nr:thiol-disulfide oxidoreductase DCC family protein [Rufibacter sediminis]MBC3538253.1 thiol-disulfide oxidoreductase DCC family protein [Rufibacter sediminis]
MLPTSPTILFDGVCNLCNGFVQFVINNDPESYFRFASLQSEVGQQVLKTHGLPTEQFKSVLLLENGQLYTRSSAALRIVRRLSGGWSWLYALVIVPKFLRDPLYDWVSRNRYRWFGQQESCMLPTPALRARFLS